jgi:hypothetical protein
LYLISDISDVKRFLAKRRPPALHPGFKRDLVHRFIQLMQLDVPSALSRQRPGSTFAVGTGFRRCSGFDTSDGASLPDESCE